jgi:hypothetical protein
MNPQDPLANLHPLREPELIGWWPLAPGWWILLIVGFLCLASLIYLALKRRRRNAYRRRALRQLQTLFAECQDSQNEHQYLIELNTLLKSVALVAYPRDDVAASHGETWRAFLNSSLPPEQQFGSTLNDAVYQKTCPDIDVDKLHRSAQLWIKRHKAAL